MMKYFAVRLLLYLSLAIGFFTLLIVITKNYSFHEDITFAIKTTILILILSLLSFRFYTKFPGRRSGLIIFPIVGIWFSATISVLIFLREPYTFFYLSNGLLYIFACMFIEFFYYKKQKNTMAFIPLGWTEDLYKIEGIEWLRLDQPILPNEKTKYIVADLHSPQLDEKWQKFLAECSLQKVNILNIRDVKESLTGRIKIHHMDANDMGSWTPPSFYPLFKRILDIAIVVLSLPITLPIMIITAIIIKLESEGGILFSQIRVGENGEEFLIYKFRSMCKDSEKYGAKFSERNDMRITRTGQFIRKTRIDELPQFFNILKGDMSLIGPRPEQKNFVRKFEKSIPFYNYRHIVKPGISGWAQVMHGYTADIDETQVKVEYDFYYIKNFSFSLDVLIFFKTIKTMLTGFGAR